MATAVWQEERARREETVRLGLWMFLATVAMLFAAFASAYIVRRSGSDWTRINLPPVLWLNTVLLIASSVVLEAGAWNGSRRRWPLAIVGFSVALLLGVAFMAGQVSAWQSLMDAGVYMPATPHSAFFYMLTAVHGLHVVAAIVLLAWTTWRTFATGRLARTAAFGGDDHGRQWDQLAGATRTFWHFLLGIWIFVFVLIAAF